MSKPRDIFHVGFLKEKEPRMVVKRRAWPNYHFRIGFLFGVGVGFVISWFIVVAMYALRDV